MRAVGNNNRSPHSQHSAIPGQMVYSIPGFFVQSHMTYTKTDCGITDGTHRRKAFNNNVLCTF